MRDRMPRYDWYCRRWEILQRDNFTCRYCGQFAPNVMLEVDHVVAICDGGDDSPDNLITCCRACNRGKEAYRARVIAAERRAARSPRPRPSGSPTAVEGILTWIRQQAAPVDKYEITNATGFSERAVAYAIADLAEAGAIRQAGKRSRRVLWESAIK